jgi:hypothetical protein
VHKVDGEVFWRKDGTPVWVEYTSTPIRDRGVVVGAVIVFRDVSQRREADEKLHAALAEVDRLRERLELENAYLQEEIRIETNPRGIIGQSEAIQKTLRQVKLVAPTSAAVMITGESGTGKELIARAIHEAEQPPRPAADPGQLRGDPARTVRERVLRPRPRRLHRRDARPHRPLRARRRRHAVPRRGRRNSAGAAGQAAARAAGGNFERVGEERTRAVDVRLIAATNRDLKQECSAAGFARTCISGLNVFPVESVPLRDRREDIPLLAQHFLKQREQGAEIRAAAVGGRRAQAFALRLARQRPRTAERDRARRDPRAERPAAHRPARCIRRAALPRRARVKADSRPAVMTSAEMRAHERANILAALAGLLRQSVRPRRRRRDARHQADHAGLAHQGAGD